MTRLRLRHYCLVAVLLCKNGGARSSDITRQPQIVMEVSPFVVCVSQACQTNDRQPEVLRAVRTVHVFVLPGGCSPPAAAGQTTSSECPCIHGSSSACRQVRWRQMGSSLLWPRIPSAVTSPLRSMACSGTRPARPRGRNWAFSPHGA
jgi:hypothetical protein